MSEPGFDLDALIQHLGDTTPPPEPWPARRELAAALRSLLGVFAATDVPSDVLRAGAEEIRALHRSFAAHPRFHELAGVAEGSFGGMETFQDRSPIVGPANPVAPPVAMSFDAAARRATGRVTFGSVYEGAPGCVHGGFVAAVFDEVLGTACIFSGHPGMTGYLTTHYRSPTPVLQELRFEARLERVEGRKILARGECWAGERLTAESEGLFIAIDRAKFEALDAERRRRLDSAPA